MQVSNPNNVKIYNLSAGKSLPEWLSDRYVLHMKRLKMRVSLREKYRCFQRSLK